METYLQMKARHQKEVEAFPMAFAFKNAGCGKNEEFGVHEYAEEKCPKCGAIFCWDCCGGTNVHHGGKYEPDYMLCPVCKTDVKSA